MTNITPKQEDLFSNWVWILVVAVGFVDAIWIANSYIVVILQFIAFHQAGAVRASDVAANLDATIACAFATRSRSMYRHGVLTIAWPVLRIFNHLTMTTGFPLADDLLAKSDAKIGFDWMAYVQWIDGQPTLIKLIDYTYSGLTGYSITLYLLILLGPRAEEGAAEFLKLFILSAICCSTIGMFFPALSAAVYYNPSMGDFANIDPSIGAYHLSDLLRLRSDPNVILEVNRLPGLVTFPSFHTAMGVIAIYCARRHPVLLAGSLFVNLIMISSTPVFGAHYAIDIAGGVLVAWVLIIFHAKAISPGFRAERVPSFFSAGAMSRAFSSLANAARWVKFRT